MNTIMDVIKVEGAKSWEGLKNLSIIEQINKDMKKIYHKLV